MSITANHQGTSVTAVHSLAGLGLCAAELCRMESARFFTRRCEFYSNLAPRLGTARLRVWSV